MELNSTLHFLIISIIVTNGNSLIFQGTILSPIQGWRINQANYKQNANRSHLYFAFCLAYISVLNMEAVHSSETAVNVQKILLIKFHADKDLKFVNVILWLFKCGKMKTI
jgi:hypothetical protein